MLHLFQKKQTNRKFWVSWNLASKVIRVFQSSLLEFFPFPQIHKIPFGWANRNTTCFVCVCVWVSDVLTKRGPLGSFYGIQTSVVLHHQGQNSRNNSWKPHKSFSSHPRVVFSILTTTIKVAKFVLVMAVVPGRSLQTVLERTDVSYTTDVVCE